MDQQIPSPHDPSSKPNSEPPSWIPRWMSDRERMAIIIALGIILAAFVFNCAGCCSGIMQYQVIDSLK